MGWGNAANVTTTHLDSSADDPSQARAEIYSAFLELQAVIGGRGTASGVAPLDASSKIANTYLPNTIASSVSTDLTLAPATARVNIEDLVNLNPKTVAELQGLTPVAGDVAYSSNGNAGQPCLAVYTGDDDSNGQPIWYKIALGVEISSS